MEEVIGRLEALGNVSVPTIPDITKDIFKEPGRKGRGGFCEVYVGRHRSLGKVALRLPSIDKRSDADQRRFWREMGILLKLDHKNINPLVGMYCDNEGYHMVSPWMENGSVHSCIANDIPFDSVKVLRGIAEALNYLHENCVIHGDLKLDNVLLSPDGEAKLIDFGLAKMSNLSLVTSTAMKGAGSVAWQALEIMNGEPRSTRTDVWAFGMVIAECLTRKPPFWDAKNSGNVVSRIVLKKARPDPRDVSLQHAGACWPQLWSLASECWHQEPSDRPNMAHVVECLTKLEVGVNALEPRA